ncbi:MAG TPA: hypothetical protein VG015_01925, partial [Candidatus Dormibacteraeota bacterium]|nr:hypothetical protein [Candidatus Dormibacteraeota bacterium]
VDALAGGVLVTGGGLLLAVGAGVVVGYVAATAAAWTYDHWGEITHHPDQASREALKDGGNWFGQQAQGAGNLLHNLTG